ncbi:hypothetical protein [Streptomyces sp. NPDC091268]|uniref:hypothetical protein n=1 Tax=Streptomyces sp. NPDC091268 TaxID=3365979 RepID=UPI00382D45A3
MSEYKKYLIAAAVGVLIALFGFTPPLFGGAEECDGETMKPGAFCESSNGGGYGYDSIDDKNAENQRNKRLIFCVIGGIIVLGATGFAVREAVGDGRYAARSRRRESELRACAAQPRWQRPADPGKLLGRSTELTPDGVELYTRAMRYTAGFLDGGHEIWVPWDRITKVEDDRRHFSHGGSLFSVKVSTEGITEPLRIDLDERLGHGELVSKMEQLAAQGALPKLVEFKTTGILPLRPAGADGTHRPTPPGPNAPTDVRLTVHGFTYRQHQQDHTLSWRQITRLTRTVHSVHGRCAAITSRDGVTLYVAADCTTADVAAFLLAHQLWSGALSRG